jgi:DNA polymerase-3 subunit chi
MPQVDFYILSTPIRTEKDRLACQITEKAWQQGYRVYLQTDSPKYAKRLDNLLWTFHDISFLPHEIYSQVSSATTPILIGYQAQTCPHQDVLINLTEEIPSFVAQFKRIAEIVDEPFPAREAGRRRYRSYQQQPDYSLKIHHIQR